MFDGLKRMVGIRSRSFIAASQKRRAQGLGRLNRYDSATAQAVSTLRARARFAYQNSPYVNGGVRGLVSAMVGDGDRPVLAADASALGAVWEEWAASCGPDGESFAAIERQVVESTVIDGESFIHLGLNPETLRLTLSPISSDRIDDQKTVNLPGGSTIIAGIELSPTGREVAYWIHPFDPGLVSGWRPSVRVPAESVLRVWRPPGAGAVRGTSWLAPIIVVADQADGLFDALLISARTAASNAAFISGADASGDDDPLDSEALAEGLEPGRVSVLPEGWEVHLSSRDTMRDAPGVLKYAVRSIAAGLNVPSFMIDRDAGDANYSSMRSEMIAFRAYVSNVRANMLVPQFLSPVWRTFQAIEFASGRLSAFGVPADWIQPSLGNIDPQREAEAIRTRLELGITSRRAEILASGRDPAVVAAEIAAEPPIPPRLQQTTGSPANG